MTDRDGFSSNALQILQARYFMKTESGEFLDKSPADLFARVADFVATAEKAKKEQQAWSRRFLNLMVARDFLPNSPTLTGAGRDMCLSACFVLPVEDSMPSIFDAVKNTALVHKEGGGTGFDFSQLRPQGSFVRKTQGVASGPLSFLKVIDAATEAVKQGGTRRGANMGVLRVDHPDIEEFISMKKDGESVTNFNISVAITDDFMKALKNGGSYDIVDPYLGKKVGKKNARQVFDAIVHSAWLVGDPGLLFIDRINQLNPTKGLGLIRATNPCGEQPLHSYESCNLGSLNLSNFYNVRKKDRIDWDRLSKAIGTAVRFLDNVIEVNRYPLPKIDETTKANRRIGLGVMGWADLLIKMKIRYDTPEALELAEKVAAFIKDAAVEESQKLAEERGSFPNIGKSVYKGKAMRNATVFTIAPTGTISRLAGCSSSIEPVFALEFTSKIIDRNTTIPVKQSQIFSTAADGQTSVTIHVLQGERSMAKDNISLGQFDLTGIPPAPRGVPQVEVTFDINADGVLNVTAKDLGTSKQMGIKITASTKLSPTEKDRMVKEADQFGEQDKRAREEAEIRNTADSLIYTSEKTLSEIGDKISDEKKHEVQEAINALKDSLKTGGLSELGAKVEDLKRVVQEAGATVYQQAAAQSASQQQSSQEASRREEGQRGKKTVDAEFKVVDDEKE